MLNPTNLKNLSRPSDALFSVLAAQAYPTLLDRETGLPWYEVELAKKDLLIDELQTKLAKLEDAVSRDKWPDTSGGQNPNF